MAKILRFMKQKNTSVIIGALVIIMICSVSITAYFTDGDRAKNRIAIGSNVIELTEEFEPPEALHPGVSFTKDVKVTNTGTVDCYVRILAVFTDSDMGKYCEVDWNTRDWVYSSEDGYWYYMKPIKQDETTTSLFTTVTLSEDIKTSEIKDFDIIIYAESYQAYGFSDYKAAWEHHHINKPD